MRGNARGPRPNVKDPGKLLLRLLSYIFKNYGFACIVVVICLFITVFSSVQGTLFMQTLIDDYIQIDGQEITLKTDIPPKLWYMSHREHSGT